ncbi:flap endonuclease 1-like [Panicum miliaceum]|uniref:Flap endonuclease 1-like n=1 Tax=Panicum miliaceum TaxID=4540 RepID=A0A3L6SQU3_PANMI|nr:flap endonuclease 1-like [Panicum miliaceum]
MRSGGNKLLKNDNGEETSHLVGMFNRTAKFLEVGIEPIYVFDGTPPDMKK